MSKINRVMLMLIAMVAIMLMAVMINKGYTYYQNQKWEKERVQIYEEARADIDKMRTTIEILSQDQDALIAYMEENELDYVEAAAAGSLSGGSFSQEEIVSGNTGTVSGNTETGTEEGVVSGNAATVSSNATTVSGNAATVSGNAATVSGNATTVSGNATTVSSNATTVSGNATTVSSNTASVSGNAETGTVRIQVSASYAETMKINARDEAILAANDIDFSEMKIACLGDSLTAAANLETEENYETMTYPYQLGQLLRAKEVMNLGIGGSTIGRYWENAFVDRYREIPEDTDLILVMGGTNDGFCASAAELGSLEERKARTFAGDLDELLKGLKENYPQAQILLVTPLQNVLHDMLRKDRDYLLPQSSFVTIMTQLAAEYEISVIDLYSSNFLNTHDAAVVHSFMPDGVHGNQEGYRILAEHLAAEIIQLYEAESAKESTAGSAANV